MSVPELRLFDACADLQRALIVAATADDGATKVGWARGRDARAALSESKRRLRAALAEHTKGVPR